MLSAPRAITVGETTFFVRTPWGLMRRFAARLAEIEATMPGQRAREAAVEEATRDLLAEVIVGWDGPRDGAGAPLPWAPERLDDLDAAVVAALVAKLAEPPEELGIKKELTG